MFISLQTSHSVDTIVERMQGAATEFGFSILHHYDFFTILEGKGFPIDRKVFVFEICKAAMSSKILTHFPLFSVMMPCRIAVYEEHGTTHIATMDMHEMLELLHENEQLQEEANALFDQILNMMSSLCE